MYRRLSQLRERARISAILQQQISNNTTYICTILLKINMQCCLIIIIKILNIRIKSNSKHKLQYLNSVNINGILNDEMQQWLQFATIIYFQVTNQIRDVLLFAEFVLI